MKEDRPESNSLATRKKNLLAIGDFVLVVTERTYHLSYHVFMTKAQYKHIHDVLGKLQSQKADAGPTLSVYLENKNKASGAKLSEDFQKLIRKTLTVNEAEKFKTAIDTIHAYLCSDYDKRHHLSDIAFFAGRNIWEVVHHDFSITNKMRLSYKPYIAPLLEALAKEGRYLFVVADREKAELFTFYQGGLEAFKEVYDPSVPQKVKSNKEEYYARNSIILRHIEDHLHRHLQKISQEINVFIKGKSIQGVFVGGHKPLFRTIKHHLGNNLQQRLQGEFVTELNIPQPELIQHAEKTLETYLQRKGVENYGRQEL